MPWGSGLIRFGLFRSLAVRMRTVQKDGKRMSRKRVVIMGAAGRDFHIFNTVFRNDPDSEVIAFTATQIPNIDGRAYPVELAGPHYDQPIPLIAESEVLQLIRTKKIDEVIFGYSDIPHENVMNIGSAVIAPASSGRSSWFPKNTLFSNTFPVLSANSYRTFPST